MPLTDIVIRRAKRGDNVIKFSDGERPNHRDDV
jgi:hypothetical protein